MGNGRVRTFGRKTGVIQNEEGSRAVMDLWEQLGCPGEGGPEIAVALDESSGLVVIMGSGNDRWKSLRPDVRSRLSSDLIQAVAGVLLSYQDRG